MLSRTKVSAAPLSLFSHALSHHCHGFNAIPYFFLFLLLCVNKMCIERVYLDIDMYEYFEDCIHAARLYILKESDDTIPAAKRHMKM